MTDLSKITSKFDLQKIIGDVKAMITPVNIPQANKNDPLGYCLSELNNSTKELTETQVKQTELVTKIKNLLGTLYQEIENTKKGKGGATTQVTPAPAASTPTAPAAPDAPKPAPSAPAPSIPASPAPAQTAPAAPAPTEAKPTAPAATAPAAEKEAKK